MIPFLIEAALRSALVAMAVWAGLRVFRVSNVLAQKAVWGLVLAAAVFMPMLLPVAAHFPALPTGATVVIPADPMSLLAAYRPTKQVQVPAARPTATSATVPIDQTIPNASAARTSFASQEDSIVSNRFPAPTISSSNTTAPAAAAEPQQRSRIRAFSAVEIAWLLYFAVTAVLIVRLLYGLGVAARLWDAAKPVVLDASIDLASELNLRSSSEVFSPVTIGSAVVLPADYDTWDSEKLRIVLAHERSHIRQGDFYLQILAGLHASLFWFSPLGWWLKRKLSDLAEAISDRAGLEEAASRSAYAQILLEFAAAPRPTLIGVAMARTGSLSRRIERLLNDSSFRQSFAGTRRRALLAVLLVPIALFGATTLIRVQAAGQAPVPPTAPTEPTAPVAGVTAPEVPAAAPEVGATVPARPAAPPQVSTIELAPAAPGTPVRAFVVSPPALPSIALVPAPPAPPAVLALGVGIGAGQSTTTERGSMNRDTNTHHDGYRYSYSSNGDSYAIIKGDGDNVQFSGNWMNGRREDLEKARKMAHGDFLWFNRGGKSYFVDDPAIVSQIEDMYKPMEALGKQQEELGRKQEDLGKQQEELGRLQEQASVPTPDMRKEIAELEETAAKLKAKQGKEMSPEEFAELQSKLGDIQGRMGEMQGQMGAKQGEFGEKMGKLGSLQGELGAQQGRLGAEQGKIAQEADRKVKGIIDQSLTNGKAHPIE